MAIIEYNNREAQLVYQRRKLSLVYFCLKRNHKAATIDYADGARHDELHLFAQYFELGVNWTSPLTDRSRSP